MRRLLAIALLFAASHADASRFRAPVIRTPVSRVPIVVSAPKLDLVAASELTLPQIALIENHSLGGIETATEFLEQEPVKEGGYLLGINGDGRHNEFAEATGLTPFLETYVELFGRPHPVRTPEFLDYITRSGEETVFLVPPKALTHEDANVTKEELEWFFENPERMKSVRFVFGAYDLPEVKRSFPVSPDEHRVAQQRRHNAQRGSVSPFVNSDPEELLSEFESEIQHAPMVRERASRGMTYFQTEAGTYIIRRILRGYFLEFFPEGEFERREAFISKRNNPKLFSRANGLSY